MKLSIKKYWYINNVCGIYGNNVCGIYGILVCIFFIWVMFIFEELLLSI